MITTKRLTRVAPLRAGMVLGILYGFIGLLVAPFIVLAAVAGKQVGGGVVFAILLPVLYGAAGFIGGIIAAALYNLIATWTGGLEFDLSDAPPTM